MVPWVPLWSERFFHEGHYDFFRVTNFTNSEIEKKNNFLLK